MKNLNSISILMVKVSLSLLVFVGVILLSPSLNNPAMAVDCCQHDYPIYISDWEEFLERCCDSLDTCVVEKRKYAMALTCGNPPSCIPEYYDPNECWYPCCDDDPVISQTDGCDITDKVSITFFEIRKSGLSPR